MCNAAEAYVGAHSFRFVFPVMNLITQELFYASYIAIGPSCAAVAGTPRAVEVGVGDLVVKLLKPHSVHSD